MANDTATSPREEPQEADFIAPGEDDNAFAMNEASGSDSDSDDDSGSESGSDSGDGPSFHPSQITAPTFRRLLDCYNTTVTQVHRRKIMLKLQPKPEKGSKRKAEKKTGSVSANMRGAALIKKTDFNHSEQQHIREEVGKFLELDTWRFEVMPRLVSARASGGGSEVRNVDEGDEDGDVREGEGAFLTKEELVRVMEWKTKHGVPRPALLGMAKSNQNKAVLKSTSTAFKALPTVDPMLNPDQAFPMQSIDALKSLRGVGPATASLILSIATTNSPETQQVPFYSDDLYLWLCLKDYPETTASPETIQRMSVGGTEGDKPMKKDSKYKRPNGELNIKYNIAEYRQLWHACQEMRQRLKGPEARGEGEGEAEGGALSMIDIEKVAYVLRNIAVSGFYPGIDPQEILQMTDEQQAVISANLANQKPAGEGKKSKKKALKEAKKAADKERKMAEPKEEEEDGIQQKKRKREGGGSGDFAEMSPI